MKKLVLNAIRVAHLIVIDMVLSRRIIHINNIFSRLRSPLLGQQRIYESKSALSSEINLFLLTIGFVLSFLAFFFNLSQVIFMGSLFLTVILLCDSQKETFDFAYSNFMPGTSEASLLPNYIILMGIGSCFIFWICLFDPGRKFQLIFKHHLLLLLGFSGLFLPHHNLKRLFLDSLPIAQSSRMSQKDYYIFLMGKKEYYFDNMCNPTILTPLLDSSTVCHALNPYNYLKAAEDASWDYSIACFMATNLSCYLTTGTYLFAFINICRELQFHKRLIRSMNSIFMEINEDFSNFITVQWIQLDAFYLLKKFWLNKILFVVLFGPHIFPHVVLFNNQGHYISNPNDQVTKLFYEYPKIFEISQRPNMTMLIDFSNDNLAPVQKYLTRFLVAILVHGTETWICIFGAASTFGFLFSYLLKIDAYLIDPHGQVGNRFNDILANPPPDIDVWNSLDDPEQGNNRIHFIAAELISTSHYFSVVPLILLAVQYDMPNLSLVERIFSFIHAILIVNLTCIYSVVALLRSLLLHLRRPNDEGSSYMSHVRPLISTLFIMYFATNIFSFMPSWIFESFPLVDNPDEVQWPTNSPEVTAVLGSRVRLFTGPTIIIRRFKIYLCAAQKLVGIISSLIDYGLHQYHLSHPEWPLFNHYLWLSRLFHAIIDYSITLMSFLTILYLWIFDSFGAIRSMILAGYLYFILYPTAARGYNWIRWKLLFAVRLGAMSQPTKEELEALGDVCAICFDDLTPDTARKTKCGHYFHYNCIARWMKVKLFCPICSSDLLSSIVNNTRIFTLNQPQPPPQPVQEQQPQPM